MEQDLLIPTYQSQATDENYEGATVIDPIKGKITFKVAMTNGNQYYDLDLCFIFYFLGGFKTQ